MFSSSLAKPLAVLLIAGALACGTAFAPPQQAHVCGSKPVMTTVKSGAYTFKVYKPKTRQWVHGGPNYRYQAALVKVNRRNAKSYTIPRTVRWKGRFYHVTEIDGDPFKSCKKARRIYVNAALAYIEDLTFWRCDRRHVKLYVWNCGTYDYLLGGSTALIQ